MFGVLSCLGLSRLLGVSVGYLLRFGGRVLGILARFWGLLGDGSWRMALVACPLSFMEAAICLEVRIHVLQNGVSRRGGAT